MDILHLIDRLEDELSRGRRLPLTSIVMLNEQRLWSVIDTMRISIPKEVDEAITLSAEAFGLSDCRARFARSQRRLEHVPWTFSTPPLSPFFQVQYTPSYYKYASYLFGGSARLPCFSYTRRWMMASPTPWSTNRAPPLALVSSTT